MHGLKTIALTAILIGLAMPAFAQLPGEPKPPAMYDSTGDARHRFERWSADARVREAQRVLQERGYYRGSLDGLMTPETRRAVWAFQKAQGFRLSGRLEAQTMAALGLGSTGTVSKDDPSNFGPQPSALPGPSSGTRRSAPAPGNLQAP